MNSLKRNHSDHPPTVSQPSLAKHILRRNSSGRREGIKLTSAPLRRNSSGKGDSSSTAPRVASMLKKTTSNSGDNITSNTPSVDSSSDSSQSQNTSHLSLVYRPHLVPSINSDHTSIPENEVNTSGSIHLSHKSSPIDHSTEVNLSSSNEVINVHPQSIFLESNKVIDETPKSLHFESNEKIEEPPDSIHLESNEEIEEPHTFIYLNAPVAKPRKLAAINTVSPVSELPPPFSTLKPPSLPQSCPPSPPTLRKSTEKAKDFTEEPSEESSPLANRVWSLKFHFYFFIAYLL